MKMLITGGAGFVGSNFTHYITNKYPDYSVVCIDALTYGNNTNSIKEVLENSNFKFINANIVDSVLIDQIFKEEQFDMVVNFAAESHVDKSINNPSLFVQTNIVGTNVLLDASRKHGVTAFHQVSTDEVYGNLPQDRLDLKFVETTPINPTNPYAASKASADLLVMSYCKTFNFKATISRCCNNYGPYQFSEKLIPLIISKAINNENVTVHGDGSHVRDWISVHDHCTAIDTIIHTGKSGEVYNVGSNNEVSTLDVVKTILKLLNKPESLITYVDDRAGNDIRYAMDSTKLHTELGWVSEHDFDNGIEKTVEWYLDNKEWWYIPKE